MSDWSPVFSGYEQRWITCPECKGQGHWFDGVSIKICKRCSNEGEIKELRLKPKSNEASSKPRNTL